jgi:hypothetical protein
MLVLFYDEEFSPHTNPKVDDHHQSAVVDLYLLYSQLPSISVTVSSICNLKTCLTVARRIHVYLARKLYFLDNKVF